MTVIAFPDELLVSRMSWAQKRNDIEFRSTFGAQAVEVSAPLWEVSIEIDRMSEESSGRWKVLLLSLRGRTNQLALWDVARPEPRGTMRGAMMLGADVTQGATTLPIVAAGEVTKTLVQGDWLGIGSGITQQIVMVSADAISDGAGGISVAIEPPLRNAFLSGAPVAWDKPKALFRRQESRAGWDYDQVFASGFRMSLLEDWRP